MEVKFPCLLKEFGIAVDNFIMVKYLKAIGHNYKHMYIATYLITL